MEKGEKKEWKSLRVPKELWKKIKIVAAKRGIKIYKELASKYE